LLALGRNLLCLCESKRGGFRFFIARKVSLSLSTAFIIVRPELMPGLLLDSRRRFLTGCVLNLLWLGVLLVPGQGAAQPSLLPGCKPLTLEGDLSAQMVAGIDRFLMREIERSVQERPKLWQRDFSANDAYEKSVQPNRERLRKYVGAVDERVPAGALEYVSSTASPAKVAETERYEVYAVRWPVFERVWGEGLMLRPRSRARASVVALPDADQTPEMLAGLAPGLAPEAQFARRLADNGCLVLMPVLIDRQDTWSGNVQLKRFTNQPHREWIYRQAFELGRHIIGYEAQKVLAAVDWFEREAGAPGARVGVFGYGEGGLIALHAAALDPRIRAAVVSGYFDSRQRVWEEPIYRNVFGLLHEFGDAEIASLVAPRSLLIEYSESPRIDGPPKARDGRSGAAPGKWATPEFNSVEMEVNRARSLVKLAASPKWLELVNGSEGTTLGPGSGLTLAAFLERLGVPAKPLAPAGAPPIDLRQGFDPAARQKRQIDQVVQHTQQLLQLSERVREKSVPSRGKSADEWQASAGSLRAFFAEEVIGRFPKGSLPPNPRSRPIYDKPKWTGSEVVLDVYPDVFAWGYLLLPKDLKPGERRPVVVCQHGLEGLPADTITDDPKSGGWGPYKAFAARLAERGFVVYAPHNPYRGHDNFRVLQRKANPLKKSLFSVIVAQHDVTLDWLAQLPFVDASRIGFYGLSYGGKTAMRVPALLDRYALSICSADFNEWVRKNATVDSTYSYLFTMEYEMPEWNLGHTFNYAEMAALIAPRPFMVERGHDDGVAPDEWVAYEYAKVRHFYDRLGLGDRTAIEFFNGPHTINGMGTFRFLHKHLGWPEPQP
jgi:dienelactone hydrolase